MVPGSPAEARANPKFSACSLSPLRNLNQLLDGYTLMVKWEWVWFKEIASAPHDFGGLIE